MKKVLVALAMIMGLGTSVAFAGVSGDTLAVEQTLQTPQDELQKLPQRNFLLLSSMHWPKTMKVLL